MFRDRFKLAINYRTKPTPICLPISPTISRDLPVGMLGFLHQPIQPIR